MAAIGNLGEIVSRYGKGLGRAAAMGLLAVTAACTGTPSGGNVPGSLADRNSVSVKQLDTQIAFDIGSQLREEREGRVVTAAQAHSDNTKTYQKNQREQFVLAQQEREAQDALRAAELSERTPVEEHIRTLATGHKRITPADYKVQTVQTVIGLGDEALAQQISAGVYTSEALNRIRDAQKQQTAASLEEACTFSLKVTMPSGGSAASIAKSLGLPYNSVREQMELGHDGRYSKGDKKGAFVQPGDGFVISLSKGNHMRLSLQNLSNHFTLEKVVCQEEGSQRKVRTIIAQPLQPVDVDLGDKEPDLNHFSYHTSSPGSFYQESPVLSAKVQQVSLDTNMTLPPDIDSPLVLDRTFDTDSLAVESYQPIQLTASYVSADKGTLGAGTLLSLLLPGHGKRRQTTNDNKDFSQWSMDDLLSYTTSVRKSLGQQFDDGMKQYRASNQAAYMAQAMGKERYEAFMTRTISQLASENKQGTMKNVMVALNREYKGVARTVAYKMKQDRVEKKRVSELRNERISYVRVV